jgi:proteasome lid subunit RPN8/RPN11
MLDQTKLDIIEHAKNEFPREACGLLLNVEGKEQYKPCRNIAERQIDFIIDPIDYAEAEDTAQIIAIVHSHCNQSAKPSQADLVSCEASRLPWHIVSIPSETWHTITPNGYKPPLLGRSFSHGVLDCYALIRDWYDAERKITLPDFDRDELWWEKGGDLYMQNFAKAGFERTDLPLERGDVILMQIGSKVANHAAIYLGNDLILHHLINRLSSREIYGGYYLKCSRLVLRFKGLE